jgi:hypothetical protein
VHVRGRWLEIEPKKGYYVPGKGAQYLYHGICPPELIEALRDRLRGVTQEYPEPNQGKRGHPAMPRNSVSGSPRILSGSPKTTRTSLSPNEETACAPGDRLPSPHVGANGDFIISEDYRLAIPAATVMQWRVRFPQIADLDAAMTGLGTNIRAKGSIHPGWTCPEGWMVKILSEMNQEAADKKRFTAARIAKVSNGGIQPRGKSRRAELDEA